jgi:serine/threonine protein kinase
MRRHERYEQRVGSTVDARWRIDALLGCGSTSAVYAATHRNGHRAALKIIHQSLCADPVLIQRFLREAGLANAIKHRAIVAIGDDGMTEDGCAYLVLELLEGETLDAMRERCEGRIPLEELAPLADELMSAISAVHAAGVVHRDLKPGNVFISKPREGATKQTRGRLKLLDFGTARIFDREMDSSLSAAGLVMGTPAFMAPEQARGARAEVDAQSDVFALGAMIFALLTGEHVHVGRDSHQQLLMAAMRPARFVATADRAIDHRVAASIDRALAYSKKDRWPDVHSFRVAFRDAVVASLPALRDLTAFVDLGSDTPDHGTPAVPSDDTVRDVTGLAADDDSLSSLPSFSSDPTLVMASPLLPNQPPGVDALRAGASFMPPIATAVELDAAPPGHFASDPPRKPRGIPIPALLLGTTAMAAAIVLVVFFLSGADDAGSTLVRATDKTVAPVSATSAPPAQPSFIEITAPDLPSSGGAAKPKTSAGVVVRRAPAAATATAVATTADAGGSSASQEEVPAAKAENAPAAVDTAVAEPSPATATSP